MVLLSSTGLPGEEILTSVETWCKKGWLCLPLTGLVWDVTIVCEMTYYDRLSVWGRVYFLVSSLICKCLLLIDMVFLWTLNSLLTVHSIRAFSLSVCRYLCIRCHNYKLISVLLFITMKKLMCVAFKLQLERTPLLWVDINSSLVVDLDLCILEESVNSVLWTRHFRSDLCSVPVTKLDMEGLWRN